MIEKSIFRAYDIRGNAKTYLTEEVAFNIGYYFAKKIISKDNKRFVVGFDGRLSTPSLLKALVLGLNKAGGEVSSIGIVPTPMLYFADKKFSPAGSIMITGSHNEKDDNGFKLIARGKSFYAQSIQNLYNEIVNKPLDYDSSAKPKIYNVNVRSFYLDRVLKDLEISKKLKVVWDTGNGSAGEVVKDLVLKLPNENFLINNEIDGNFPSHHPDPTIPENLSQLIKEVKKTKSDIGIAFDGDGDRIGVVTSKGEIIFGDHLLCIFSKELLSRKPGSIIIADVKATKSLFDYVKSKGGNALMWKCGHSHIKAKMFEARAEIAGEMSGHIFFSDNYLGYDDAIYAALRLMNIISKEGKSLEDLLSDIPKTHSTPEIRLEVSEADKFKIIDSLKSEMDKKGLAYNDIDGIRFDSSVGWWLIRASNTQAAIIIRCESDNEENLHSIKSELNTILKKYKLKI